MEKIEAQIKTEIEKIKTEMKEAKELQEQAIADHEEEADNAVETCMAEYVAANKEGGKGMTKEELEANISKSMPNSPNLAKALAKFVTASREMAEVDSLLGTLNNLVIDTKVIEADIKTKEAAKAEAVKASQETKKCSDPIGFVKNGARYDFIVDDGSFDSTSDFLGADTNWAAMEALDKDGDKVIDAAELKKAGIKMVKTENGEKKVVDIADEFGEDFKVDLTTYQQGGSFDGIDTTKDTDGDGTVDQQLLGTYTIHIGNEDVKGYNTLDDVDYLKTEYGLADAAKAADSKDEEMSAELKAYSNFFKEQSEAAANLAKELEEGIASTGITEAMISQIKDHAKKEGANDANIFMQGVQKEAEEAQKAEDAKVAEQRKKEREEKDKQEAAAAKQKETADNNNTATGTAGTQGTEGGTQADATAKYTEAVNKYKDAVNSNDENAQATALANLKETAEKAGKTIDEAREDLKKLGVTVNW